MAPAIHTDALPPMVFMCGCNNVLGDSFDFVCSVEALQSVTLKGVSGVQVDKIVQRGSLLADLDSYALGASELRIASSGAAPTEQGPASPQPHPALATPPAAAHPVDDRGAGGAAAAAGQAELEERIELLEADLLKVQNILLLHDERLEGLEACAPAPPPGQGPPNQAPPDQTQRLAAGAVLNGSAPSMR